MNLPRLLIGFGPLVFQNHIDESIENKKKDIFSKFMRIEIRDELFQCKGNSDDETGM